MCLHRQLVSHWSERLATTTHQRKWFVPVLGSSAGCPSGNDGGTLFVYLVFGFVSYGFYVVTWFPLLSHIHTHTHTHKYSDTVIFVSAKYLHNKCEVMNKLLTHECQFFDTLRHNAVSTHVKLCADSHTHIYTNISICRCVLYLLLSL